MLTGDESTWGSLLSATLFMRSLKVVLMYPGVGGILLSLDNRHGCVVRSGILFHGRVVQGARPQQRLASLWLDRYVQHGKVSPSSLLHIRKIKEESENSGSLSTVLMMLDVIMMTIVILAVVVPQELKRLLIVGVRGLGHFGLQVQYSVQLCVYYWLASCRTTNETKLR